MISSAHKFCGVCMAAARGGEREEVFLGVIMTNTEIFHIFSLFNLPFFHIVHIISLFDLPFFRIFHIFSLFNLLFFHIFHIISQFSSVFSKSFHYSTWVSSIFFISFHYFLSYFPYSTCLSSIFSISFHIVQLTRNYRSYGADLGPCIFIKFMYQFYSDAVISW